MMAMQTSQSYLRDLRASVVKYSLSPIVLCVLFVVPLRGQSFSPELRELGRMLFYDPRVSADGTVSCATCHDPNRAFTDGRRVAIGIDGLAGDRNTPTVLGAAYQDLQFADGRTTGAGEQSLQPLVNPLEMGNQSVGQVMRRLERIPGYRTVFGRVFGSGDVTPARFATAIVAFESVLLSQASPADEREAGFRYALSDLAEEGLAIFHTEGCADCHGGPLYTDGRFHNNGAAMFVRSADPGRAGILPPEARTPETIRAFKTPSLREIAKTGPYLHNGSIDTLEGVVRGYRLGWQWPEQKNGRVVMLHDARQDARVTRRRHWTDHTERALVAYLETLSSPALPTIGPPRLPR